MGPVGSQDRLNISRASVQYLRRAVQGVFLPVSSPGVLHTPGRVDSACARGRSLDSDAGARRIVAVLWVHVDSQKQVVFSLQCSLSFMAVNTVGRWCWGRRVLTCSSRIVAGPVGITAGISTPASAASFLSVASMVRKFPMQIIPQSTCPRFSPGYFVVWSYCSKRAGPGERKSADIKIFLTKQKSECHSTSDFISIALGFFPAMVSLQESYL